MLMVVQQFWCNGAVILLKYPGQLYTGNMFLESIVCKIVHPLTFFLAISVNAEFLFGSKRMAVLYLEDLLLVESTHLWRKKLFLH